MRKIVVSMFFILCAVIACAQNKSIDIARVEYQKGNYEDAVGLFNGAIATITDSKTKELLTKEKEKSSRCWRNIEQADQSFSESNYSLAQRIYENVLSDNPSDSYARNQRDRCRRNVENARQLAMEKKRIDALWVELMSSNNISKLKTFVKDYPIYPQVKDLQRVLDYYDNPAKIEKETVAIKCVSYVNFGNLYFVYNKSVAAQFYEKAAANGSLAGFYNLAISLPDIESNRKQRLLVFAAVNGIEDAVKLLDSKYPNLKYDKNIPRSIYQYLEKANRGDIYSKVIAQKNKFNIGLPKLDLIDHNSEYINSADSWQYELGIMYLQGNYVTKNFDKGFSYLFDAASKGNYTAQCQLAITMKGKDDTYYKAFGLCAAINGSDYAQKQLGISGTDLKYARAYMQYLNGEKCDFFSVYMFLSYNAKKYNCEDIDAKLVSQACYPYLDSKKLKAVSKILKSKPYWNKQTISKISLILLGSSNKYHKKLLKQLPKISVELTKITPNLFQSFVNEGFCSNPHSAKTIEVVDYMSDAQNGLAANPNKTYSSNKTTANNKETTTNNNSKYYVGQDFGVGYIFYVDGTGKHGLIVSKRYNTVSSVQTYGWTVGDGTYKWRAANGKELVAIQKTVGSKYPQQWFLSSDTNPNSVLKNKPNRYGVNFRNGQALYITGTNVGTYHTLAVAEF